MDLLPVRFFKINSFVVESWVIILLIVFLGFVFIRPWDVKARSFHDKRVRRVTSVTITPTPTLTPTPTPTIELKQFANSFASDNTIEETGSMSESSSRDWWLNSGGYFMTQDGVGMTVHGSLPMLDKWRLLYSFSNPLDTDGGYYPQNIFRLVTQSKWKNFNQQVYFKIQKDNLSESPQRNASNGVLMFNRYLDGNNLYYTGVRVDGGVVIKKKINGEYFTLGYRKYWDGSYDRGINPNLLPKEKWIGVKSELISALDDSVTIRLYLDVGRTSNWELVLQVTDKGNSFGIAPIQGEGFGGIRSDFMDVQFDDYKISEMK